MTATPNTSRTDAAKRAWVTIRARRAATAAAKAAGLPATISKKKSGKKVTITAGANTIYTIGSQRLRLADLQALVSNCKIKQILDWRETPAGKLTRAVLDRAFPGRYKYVGDKCNENLFPLNAINKLHTFTNPTLLIFSEENPATCRRHKDLALPLLSLGTPVIHVHQDELIEAGELQRSLVNDDEYAHDTWRTQYAPAAAPTQTQPLAPIETIADVTDRAILVKLTVRMFGISREDKEVNAETAARYGADPAMTKFTKDILASESFAHLSSLESNIRTEHYRRTTPWYDGGLRALAMTGYMDYAAFMRDAEPKWKAAVEDVLDNWDNIVAQGKKGLGSLAEKISYPSRTEAARRFEFAYRAMPIPKTDDWRNTLSADEVKVLKAQYEATLEQAMKTSATDIWIRLSKVITAMRDSLADVNKTFRDSLVSNITDLLGIIPSLNLTGDTTITDFCEQVRQELAAYDPDTLRKNKKVRTDVARRADEILSKMSIYMSA